MSSLPRPDLSAFEETPHLVKKKKYTEDEEQNEKRCPETPFRTPPTSRLFQHEPFPTEPRRGPHHIGTHHFDFICKLGEGSFGQVWKARRKSDDKMVAIKRSKRPIWNIYAREKQLSEIENVQALGYHENIVQILGGWQEGAHLYIVSELMEGRSLKTLIAREGDTISEDRIWMYFLDIILGVHHIHCKNFTHFDLKPDNFLLSGDLNTLKVGDFGLAFCNTSNGERMEGDASYMAPELLQDIYTPAADVFSLGISMYELITNLELPINGQHWRNLREGIIECPSDYRHSSNLFELVCSMMHPDYRMRPTLRDLLTLSVLQPYVNRSKSKTNRIKRQLRFSDVA